MIYSWSIKFSGVVLKREIHILFSSIDQCVQTNTSRSEKCVAHLNSLTPPPPKKSSEVVHKKVSPIWTFPIRACKPAHHGQEARASVVVAGGVDGGARNPCWSCAVIASRSCAAAAAGDRIEDAIRVLQELPADELSDSVGALPLAGTEAVRRKKEGGKRDTAWLEALWAVAGTGDAAATVRLAEAAREHGVALTIEHYNRALRTLEANQSRPRWPFQDGASSGRDIDRREFNIYLTWRELTSAEDFWGFV